MYTLDREDVMDRYNLKLVQHIERYIAQAVDVKIPFNNCVTGSVAFSHKAGVHSKAVVADPSSYEVINPADFGVERMIQFAHRLTGWNAMAHRAKTLGLDVSDDQIRAATTMIKDLADEQDIRLDHVDEILINLGNNKNPASSSQLRVMAENAPPALQGALKAAVDAVAEVEKNTAMQAVAEVDFTSKEERASSTVKVVGHLFDSSMLNRLLDTTVDSPCTFEVLSLDVPQENDSYSQCLIKLWGASDRDLEVTLLAMKEVVDDIATDDVKFEIVYP
jgi:homocitrate synthase